MIQFNNEWFWLYAPVDPDTNEVLQELAEKHGGGDAVFLVPGPSWLHASHHELDLRFRHVTQGNRNAIERLFKEIKRGTEQFANHVRHTTAESAENWFGVFAFTWN